MAKILPLNQRVLQRINSNAWMQDRDLAYEVGLDTSDKVYKIFEGVFVNVSASTGKHWRDVYNAKETQLELFSTLCVCSILIDYWLERRFNIEEEVRIKLMGGRLSQIVYRYKIS
jgi:hypothetical protein